jgi:hypothetical protein
MAQDEPLARLGAFPNRGCPVCDDTHWLPGAPGTRAYIQLNPDSDDPGTLVVITLVCATCGFLRLHNEEVLMDHPQPPPFR